MTLATATARALGALAAGMLAIGTLAACTPAPEPKPTKTALFDSDEEAFKAAEETYRAYTDALNKVDTSNPDTFEPLFDFTTGDFEARERKNLSTMHAEAFVLSGAAIVSDFEGRNMSEGGESIEARICLDVSGVDVLNANGQSIVSPDRPDVQSTLVTFISDDDALLIARAEDESPSTCEP